MNQAYQAYQQTQAETAPPAELVVMLYRGAIRFVTSASAALEAGDRERAHNHLVRTQAIISELAGSLDMTRGGEIARNLVLVYDYMNQRLVEANVQKSAAPALEVQRLLRDLLSAWEQAARQPGTQLRPTAAARPAILAA